MQKMIPPARRKLAETKVTHSAPPGWYLLLAGKSEAQKAVTEPDRDPALTAQLGSSVATAPPSAPSRARPKARTCRAVESMAGVESALSALRDEREKVQVLVPGTR